MSLSLVQAHSIPLLLDKVIATVGQEVILYSELEEAYKQLCVEGKLLDASAKKKLLYELVLNKIFLAKAIANDVKIPSAYIERECDLTLTSWIKHIGSEEKLIAHFHQPIYMIRKDLKRILKEKHLVMSVHQSLTEDTVVTPAEVAAYFARLPQNKRTFYPTSFEVHQLVVYPKIALDRQEEAKQVLLECKTKLLTGKASFAELAKVYSEDAGSASQGGTVGWFPFGVLDPTYEAAALALQVGGISDPILSPFGLHLIELLGRTKYQYHTRHMLKVLQPTAAEVKLAEVNLHQIRSEIIAGKSTFETAVKQYSEDALSRDQGGLLPHSHQNGAPFASRLIASEDLDPAVYFAIYQLKEGEVSTPQWLPSPHRSGWRLLYLKKKVDAHEMNLAQDYEKIHDYLLKQKKQEAIHKWVQTEKSAFIIDFDPDYKEVMQLF
ncbi:MAG: peptidylprolyl isomerase [Amoebophilaceae bacterium]|nr:peptidylprolyl isomerase [Amoebophilaceae bacterium]